MTTQQRFTTTSSRMAPCLLAAVCWVGCGDDATAATGCLPDLPRSELGECSLAFPASYARVHERLRQSCGATASACHTDEGMAGGLVLRTDAEAVHETLLGPQHGEPLVIPGDPECSPLMARLESQDPAFQMPPGNPLSAPERCAIIQWIADGAERD